MRFRKTVFCGMIGGLALAVAGSANAAAVPTLDDILTEGSVFRWVYRADNLQVVEPGDFFTIYDFQGFVPGSNSEPAGWEFSAQNVGLTPPKFIVGGDPSAVVNDDPGVVNLTWIRVGPATGGDGINSDFLGLFSAQSTLNQIAFDDFASRSTRAIGPAAGTPVDSVGTVAVPIPLPAAALMFPLGALFAGVCYRRMRRA